MEFYFVEHASVIGEGVNVLTLLNIPDLDGPIVGTRNDHSGIGGKYRRFNPVRMAFISIS